MAAPRTPEPSDQLLDEVELVGLTADGEPSGLTPQHSRPGSDFTSDKAYFKGEDGCWPNPNNIVEFHNLELTLRSRSKQKLHLAITIHGEFRGPRPGDAPRLPGLPPPPSSAPLIAPAYAVPGTPCEPGVIGTQVRCLDPGQTRTVQLVCERGFKGLLVLMAWPVLRPVPEAS